MKNCENDFIISTQLPHGDTRAEYIGTTSTPKKWEVSRMESIAVRLIRLPFITSVIQQCFGIFITTSMIAIEAHETCDEEHTAVDGLIYLRIHPLLSTHGSTMYKYVK